MYIIKSSHMLKSLIAALIGILLLSGCNENVYVPLEETTTSPASVTTDQTTVESKLEPVSEDMPEIVFIVSNRYYDENISGFYIMNTGEIKMYDFREIAPDEIYEIPDVYERLEEATCSEIFFDVELNHTRTITEQDLDTLTKDELIQDYNNLLLINGMIEYNEDVATIPEHMGHYRLYGVRNNDLGEREIILLYGYGRDYEYFNSDQRVDELWSKIECKLPKVPLYLD
jgi:hypothetical protein